MLADNKVPRASSDLTTDNNNDLVITGKDLTLHSGEGAKLFALRNYLNANKQFIVEHLNEDAIAKLVLSKCLDLGLDMNKVKFDPTLVRQGVLDISLKLRVGR